MKFRGPPSPPANFAPKKTSAKNEVKSLSNKNLLEPMAADTDANYTYTVMGHRAPISRHWGLTGDEIRLASDAAHYLSAKRFPLFWAVVADAFLPERAMREQIRLFKQIVAKEQARAGLPGCFWVEMLEGKPAVHSNLLFPLKGEGDRIAARMLESERFSGDMLDIQRTNARAFVGYCAKERTPQARYVGGVGNLARRLKGSHPLGAGGGDRVRLSKALMGELGVIPHRRVYAARTLPPVAMAAPVILIELDLFGGLLIATVGETKQRPPQQRPKIAELYGPQLGLPLELAPSVIELAAGLGETHAAIAVKIGLSRPQVTNIIQGRFGPSRRVVERVLELARAA
jgi:hypothetical protein